MLNESGSPVKKEFQGLPDKKFFTYSGELISDDAHPVIPAISTHWLKLSIHLAE